MQFIQCSGLNSNKLRGQAHGGAGNMAGRTKGAAAIISLDLHCTSHSLNVAVVKPLEVQSVHYMIGVIKKVARFFKLTPNASERLRRQ